MQTATVLTRSDALFRSHGTPGRELVDGTTYRSAPERCRVSRLASRFAEPNRVARWMGVSLIWMSAQVVWSAAPDDLRREASWKMPAAESVQAELVQWMATLPLDPPQRDEIMRVWHSRIEQAEIGSILDPLVATFAAVDEQARELKRFCDSPMPDAVPTLPALVETDVAPFVLHNLRLYFGAWLARQALYDEALAQLQELETDQVADPAALLFYRGVAQHRLLNKAECLADVSRLLENESMVPSRYLAVARLMDADMRPLKEDSLDEVSRLMEDVRRRLRLGRAGTRVRGEEQEVIAKLDKMIEAIEKQQQQQQQSSSAGGGGSSNSPASRSIQAGLKGPGDIDRKDLGKNADWGNLPPKERQEALQQISRDLPAHFREVIEEYFRKLARDGE